MIQFAVRLTDAQMRKLRKAKDLSGYSCWADFLMFRIANGVSVHKEFRK